MNVRFALFIIRHRSSGPATRCDVNRFNVR